MDRMVLECSAGKDERQNKALKSLGNKLSNVDVKFYLHLRINCGFNGILVFFVLLQS